METYFANIESAQSSTARHRVLADLRALAHDSEVLLKLTAGDVGDSVRTARARLASGLGRARSSCDALQGHTYAAARAAAREADSVVRRHPVRSVGLAFAAGVVLGLLCSRK